MTFNIELTYHIKDIELNEVFNKQNCNLIKSISILLLQEETYNYDFQFLVSFLESRDSKGPFSLR